jgi:hypothetical protein
MTTWPLCSQLHAACPGGTCVQIAKGLRLCRAALTLHRLAGDESAVQGVLQGGHLAENDLQGGGMEANMVRYRFGRAIASQTGFAPSC